jgi:hypothetical protein
MDNIAAVADLASGFEWFTQPAESRDPARRDQVTNQLVDLWAEVRDEVGAAEFDSVLGAIRVGRFTMGSDGAWVQTNGEEEAGFINLTLEMDAKELSLNVIGWYDPQLEQMERWLRKPAAWRFLRELEDWCLVIFVRKATVGPSGRAIFRGAPGVEQERIEFAETSPGNVSTRLIGMRPRLDSDHEKLALHIRRSWSFAEVTALDSPAAAIAREVEPWLDPIQQMRVA